MRNPYENLVKKLTVDEHKELTRIENESNRAFRNFWIQAMHRRGWTSVAIAKSVELSESTVRAILKKP